MRDFLIFILCFSSLHTTLFALNARELDPAALPPRTSIHCPYYDWWSLLFLLLIFGTSGLSLYASVKGWGSCERWTWVVDATGILPGILWQISTRPASYGVGGLTHDWDYCGYEHNPSAQLFRMLGEWLTYGAILRLTQSADFGTHLLPTVVIVFLAIVLSGAMYVLAAVMRDMLALRDHPPGFNVTARNS
jgi:hypothetical protein